jgi:hypothetical protein
MAAAIVEYQRSNVGNTGLYDHVCPGTLDGFLDSNVVLRKLNDRTPKPVESIYIFLTESDP